MLVRGAVFFLIYGVRKRKKCRFMALENTKKTDLWRWEAQKNADLWR